MFLPSGSGLVNREIEGVTGWALCSKIEWVREIKVLGGGIGCDG